MMEIAGLVTLCQAVLAGGDKVLEAYRKRRLSEEEKELMIAAAPQGQFLYMTVNEIPGPWVRVGNRDFCDTETNDPAYAAKYIEALEGLIKHGYIRHEVGHLFMLTVTGFKKARELTSRSSSSKGRHYRRTRIDKA